MKLTKKKVFVVALAVCLVAILSMGSLAWFTDADDVTNKFLIADSEDDTPDEIFSVDVKERVDTDGDGVYDATIDVAPNESAGFTYKDILPGDKLVKEPVIKNTGHYDQYIRVTVTISDATAWLNAVGENIAMNGVFVGFDESKWNNISKAIEGSTDTVTYVLYYNDILESGKEFSAFTHVKIPESLTREQAVAFGGEFTIDVKAEAVQTENVTPNNGGAYEAFRTVGLA